MKIVQVGSSFNGVKKIGFYSQQTYLEDDVLIIDVNVVAQSSIHYNSSFFKGRRDNLEEFISFKKMPIIYLAFEQDSLFVKGAHNNAVSTPVGDLFPGISAYSTLEEIGTELVILPKTPFCHFFEKYKSWFGYQRYYKEFSGSPIVRTPYTNRVLAFYTDDAVVLPKITRYNHSQEKEFLDDLLDCVKKVKFDPNSSPLPKWTENYYLPGELRARELVTQLHEQIRNLTQEIEKVKSEIKVIADKKRLFTAFGDELELKTEELFRELGFEILQAERNRDDLIVKYGDQIAVIEVKGLSNSAGEKNAAQLEKWRASYLESHDVDPKGILLVNSYRDIPLVERNQPDFPDQMLRYSKGREHCLITTVQFLTLYFYVCQNPGEKEDIINSLFETVGRYPDKLNWKDYISISNKDEG